MKKKCWIWGFTVVISVIIVTASGCGGGNVNSAHGTKSSTSSESSMEQALYLFNKPPESYDTQWTVSIGRWGRVTGVEDPNTQGFVWKDIVPADKKVYDKAYGKDITVETYNYSFPVFNHSFDRVAFLLTVTPTPEDKGPKKQYVVISDLQGKEIKRFEFEKEIRMVSVAVLSWSYNDSYILADAEPILSVINIKTGNVQELTNDMAGFAWSPDSLDIAYLPKPTPTYGPEGQAVEPIAGLSSRTLKIVNAQTGRAREYQIPGTGGITWLPKVDKIVLGRKAYDAEEQNKLGDSIPAELFDPETGQTSEFGAKNRFVPLDVSQFTEDGSHIIADTKDTQLNGTPTVYMGFDGSEPLVVKEKSEKAGNNPPYPPYLNNVNMKKAIKLQDNRGNAYLLSGKDYFIIKGTP